MNDIYLLIGSLGLVTGFVTTVVWSELTRLDAVISVRFVSWVLAFLAVWLVSLYTRNNNQTAHETAV